MVQFATPRSNFAKLSNGVNMFYLEAGEKTNPTLLLLHGFPTSSRQFSDLIFLLAPHFHLVAPDLPGYGLTELPENYVGSFDKLAESVDLLLDELSITKFSIYAFDYGAPTGYRIALKRPKDILAVVSQNGNAYEEGLGEEFWAPLKTLWKFAEKGSLSPSEKQEYADLYEKVSAFFLSLDCFKHQYFDGENDLSRVNPELPFIDFATLQSFPNTTKHQMDLAIDYGNNLKLYPQFQKFFRDSNVPILAIWGVNDPIFVKEGARAYKRDSKNLKIVDIDGGHFVSRSHSSEIAQEILQFFRDFEFL